MTAVIFGANGQDGFYLNQLLLKLGYSVIGVSRNGDWVKADVSNYTDVEQIIKGARPDIVFHLAANSTTRHDVLFENHATISTGAFNILESVRLWAKGCRVFISGSGLQFVNEGKPIKETDPFEASSPYSVSRIQSVYAARYYRSLGISTYVGYFFNHDSPLRPERHMAKKIAMIAGRIAKGSDELLEIGDITVRKEWGFSGDIVEAVYALVNQETTFEATIGTGDAYSIEQWLDVCFRNVHLDWEKYVRIKDGFKPEYDVLVSDPSTIKSLGWKPVVSFQALANLMMDISNE